MIPERVKLKGFLCYKEEQEITFEGASLWMLAGLNGSGKSTVFDGLTYALFGHHRGGSQDAQELINKDSDRAAVEFDFALDGQRFQAYRTVQLTKQGKGKGTQQIYRRLPDGAKEAVEGTNLRSGFDSWVQENIGLSYETFTSSVLLLQGKADKLLDSTAKGRHEVLAGIVDLERYQRLHQRADEQRKNLDGEAKSLRQRLAGLPEVRPPALAEADELIASTDAARQQAHKEVEKLQSLSFQAQRWAELQNRLATVRLRLQQAQKLLADASAIERDVNRLRELSEVLPRLQTIVQLNCQVRESELKTGDLEAQKQKWQAKLGQEDQTLGQAQEKRTTLEKRIAGETQRHRDVSGQLRTAAALLEKLKEYERQESEFHRLETELASLPVDPAAVLRQAQDTHDRLALLAGVVPILARFQQKRDELKQARAAVTKRAADRQAVQTRGEQKAAEVERLKPQLEEARRQRLLADEQATKTRTLLEQARQQLEALTELRGAKVCRLCGQPLTAAHLREEQRRRKKEVGEADKLCQQLAADQQTAQRHEQELDTQLARLDKQLKQAREEFLDHRHRAEQANKDAERLAQECSLAYHELPDPYRAQICPEPAADWLDTTFPTAPELDEARKQASGLGRAQRSLREAQQLQVRWNTLKGQATTARQNLERLKADLPADRRGVRQEHVRLEAEEQVLDRSLVALRQEAASTQEQLDRLARQREASHKQLAGIQGQMGSEETTRRLCRQTLDKARQELPLSWQAQAGNAGLAELHNLNDERDRLVQQGTDERGRSLQQARVGLESQRQEKDDLERQQEQFPEEARQDQAQIQALMQQARQTAAIRDEELLQARQHKVQLEGYCRQREQLEKEAFATDKALAHAKALAELLGRDRLQLHLVRQAERQVVDHANAVLDRLSEGQLHLRLCGEAGGDGTSAKALELEAHNRSAGDRPINVAFLSGSQKFRVAVSLALGIGQYASRGHRPIESVIIDEGFGCLDKEGRQAMIQEMQNLRDHLKCILLVSHQEEFAETFADGYLFELKDKTVRATRFQR